MGEKSTIKIFLYYTPPTPITTLPNVVVSSKLHSEYNIDTEVDNVIKVLKNYMLDSDYTVTKFMSNAYTFDAVYACITYTGIDTDRCDVIDTIKKTVHTEEVYGFIYKDCRFTKFIGLVDDVNEYTFAAIGNYEETTANSIIVELRLDENAKPEEYDALGDVADKIDMSYLGYTFGHKYIKDLWDGMKKIVIKYITDDDKMYTFDEYRGDTYNAIDNQQILDIFKNTDNMMCVSVIINGIERCYTKHDDVFSNISNIIRLGRAYLDPDRLSVEK